jgi:hypothetical protein
VVFAPPVWHIPKLVWGPGGLAMLSSYRRHGRKNWNNIRT